MSDEGNNPTPGELDAEPQEARTLPTSVDAEYNVEKEPMHPLHAARLANIRAAVRRKSVQKSQPLEDSPTEDSAETECDI